MPCIKITTEQGKPVRVRLMGELVNISRWDSRNQQHTLVIGRTDAIALADALVDLVEADTHE